MRGPNREGPNRAYPPPLDALAIRIGTTTRVDAAVDFGVTSDRALVAASEGTGNYADDGPYRDLRLLAKIDDPSYLMAAVKAAFMEEEFSSQENLCDTYRQTFAGTSAFDAREYAGLGAGGCPIE